MGRLARVLLGYGGEHAVEEGGLVSQQAFGEARWDRFAALQLSHEEVAEEGVAGKATAHYGVQADLVAGGEAGLDQDGGRWL